MSRNEDLGILFGAMSKSKETLFLCCEDELDAKENLKKAEAAVLIQYAENPKELGGNDAARNARIRDLTTAEREALDRAEKSKRLANFKYEMDSLAVECLKWQIRNDQAIAALGSEGYEWEQGA